MARRYFGGKTPHERCTDNALSRRSREVTARYLEAMDAYEFQRALEAIWELLAAVDGYVNENAPWSIAKTEGNALAAPPPRAAQLPGVAAPGGGDGLAGHAERWRRRLLAQLGVGAAALDESALAWGGLPLDAPLGEEGALFPRVDVEAYFAEVKVETNDRPDTQKIPIPAEAPVTPAAAVAPAPAAAAAAAAPTVEQVGIDEFARIKLVVGTVKLAERVPKSNKLVRMEVDLGEAQLRQIVAGIGKQYEPEQLVGRQIVVVSNLKPATLMGVESRGMVLAATLPDGAPVLLAPGSEVPSGSGVR